MNLTLALVLSLVNCSIIDSTLCAIEDILIPLIERSGFTEELRTIYVEIEAFRNSNYPETSVAFWAESSIHGAVFSNENEVWPTASTIKIFILIAAYMEYKDTWNEVPEELPCILNYELGHQEPLSMFNSSVRHEIQNMLWNMTYNELAESMMGVSQSRIGNPAYNAACNVLIFLLGGDTGGCTNAIHAIHPSFSSVQIGRYMLEPRTSDNDNMNSMRSIASACRMIFTHNIEGLSLRDHQEIQDCFQKFAFHGSDNFQKHGHLTSTPGVNAWIGWFQEDECFFLYGVNVLCFEGTSNSDEGADYYRDLIRDQLYQLSNSL